MKFNGNGHGNGNGYGNGNGNGPGLLFTPIDYAGDGSPVDASWMIGASLL